MNVYNQKLCNSLLALWFALFVIYNLSLTDFTFIGTKIQYVLFNKIFIKLNLKLQNIVIFF